MQNNSHWEKEEFEDLVARSLIGLYDIEQHKHNKRYPTEFRVSDKELLFMRNKGCYFVPHDRCAFNDEIDMVNDGYPSYATISFTDSKSPAFSFDWLKSTYFDMTFMRKLDKLPGGVKSKNQFKQKEIFYSLTCMNATEKEKLHLQKTFVSADEKGFIHDTLFYSESNRLYLPATQCTHKNDDGSISNTDVFMSSMAIKFFQDRRYLWNVTAKEGIAKASFGCYPEEIKSLFYSRELPMTETGRKRPILHWVAAHNRRIKSGIEVDIEKHLRGINEFIYQGTKFIITRPIKDTKIPYENK